MVYQTGGAGVTLTGMKKSDMEHQLKRLENVLALVDQDVKEVRKTLKLLYEIEKDKYEVKAEPKKEERKAYTQDE